MNQAQSEELARRLAAIADSPSLARMELVAAREISAGLGAELAEVPVAELDVPGHAPVRRWRR